MSVIKAAAPIPVSIETIRPEPVSASASTNPIVLGRHDPPPFVPLFGPQAPRRERGGEPSASRSASFADRAAREGPSVELLREGEAVRAIVVHCRCGEQIRLDCEF